MLLSPENIQQQTRALWESSFPEVSSERLDLYFQRRYADERNVTVRHDGKVRAAVQVLPFKFLFGGKGVSVGHLNGLCAESGADQGKLEAQVVRQALRKMYDEGQMLSFLIPHDEKHRKAIEKSHLGSFWTATHRLLVPFDLPENYRPDSTFFLKRLGDANYGLSTTLLVDVMTMKSVTTAIVLRLRSNSINKKADYSSWRVVVAR